MGFLKRFRNDGPNEVPDWADVMDPVEYAAYLEAVTQDLTRRGFHVVIDDGYAVVDRGDAEPYRFGLTNLVQSCHATERTDWSAVIATHFSNLLSTAGRDLAALAADYEQASRILRVRIMPDASAGLDLTGSVTRPIATGIQAVLVYDFPDSTANVRDAHLDRWPVDLAGAFAQGLANQVEALPTPSHHDTDEIQMSTYLGESFYVATWALRLTDVLPPGTTDALVAVPTRHALIVHPIVDMRAITSLSAMHQFASMMARQGPGSISDQPYWWHDGAFTLVPFHVDRGKVDVVPPDGLMAVLETVADVAPGA